MPTVKSILETEICLINKQPGGRLIIKMLSHQYGDFHMKIRRFHDPIIFKMEISIPGKKVFILEMGQVCATSL